MEPLGLLLNPSRDVGEGTYFPAVQRDHIITFSGLRVGAGQRNLPKRDAERKKGREVEIAHVPEQPNETFSSSREENEKGKSTCFKCNVIAMSPDALMTK